MNHIMEADSILLEFNGRRILSDIYLKCETGFISGLLGRNGQGKSCLMKIIYGTLTTESKSVRFDQKAIYEACTRPDLLTYLPQFHFIPKSFTLKQVFRDFNVNFAAFEQMFPEMSGRYRSKVGDLSGGGRRLTELYVIIKSASLFSMLDEPFTYLSPLYIEQIKELLQHEKTDKGFLVTDHMFRHITEISDRLYILKDGKTHLTKSMCDIEALGYARV